MKSPANLIERLAQWASDQPSALAIANEFKALDFTGLLGLTHTFAEDLRKVLGADQAIVGYAIRNGPDALSCELAIWSAGHIAMALPPMPTAAEAAAYLAAVKPKLLLIEDQDTQQVWQAAADGMCGVMLLGRKELSAPLSQNNAVPAVDSDLRLVQFTSGSSGKPKALLFEAQAVDHALQAASAVYVETPGTAAYSSIPQHQAMGRAVVLENLWAGLGTVVANSMAFGTHKKLMSAYNCTLVQTNPTYVRLGLQLKLWAGLPLTSRLVLGTAAAAPDLPEQIRTQRPDARVDIRYGVSEVFGALTCLPLQPDAVQHPAGHVGWPLDDVNIAAPMQEPGPIRAAAAQAAYAIIDHGDTIKLRGQDGFVDTGDLGSMATDGALTLHGRSNLFIKHRGYKIDPAEIEAAIIRFDGVVDAVVVGIPDVLDGEKIAAAVEYGPAGSLDDGALLAHCKQVLSAHKLPSRLVQLDTLPRKTSGKPDRNVARAIFRSGE